MKETISLLNSGHQDKLTPLFVSLFRKESERTVSWSKLITRTVAIIGIIILPGSSGRFSVSGLLDGSYSLRLVARSGDEERAVVSRTLTVSTRGTTCRAHLLNEGITVNGGRVAIEFSSSGISVHGFRCSLNNAPFESCK